MIKNPASSRIILEVERALSDLRRGAPVHLVEKGGAVVSVLSGEHHPDKTATGDAKHPAVKLMKLAGLLPLAVLELAKESDDCLRVSAEAVWQYPQALTAKVTQVSEAVVPLKEAINAKIIAFRSRFGHDEHLAVVIGNPTKEVAPWVRVHSSCVTGDVFGSLRCDCGNQLHKTLERMRSHGAGVFLYISQEGRGIGIANKLRAYQLQDKGLDTVDANLALGFAADERDFSLAASILKQLGITSVTLFTNNPEKMHLLEEQGIKIVGRESVITPTNPHNQKYLETKTQKLNHHFTE